jgi:hypothetical protein
LFNAHLLYPENVLVALSLFIFIQGWQEDGMEATKSECAEDCLQIYEGEAPLFSQSRLRPGINYSFRSRAILK